MVWGKYRQCHWYFPSPKEDPEGYLKLVNIMLRFYYGHEQRPLTDYMNIDVKLLNKKK